MKDILLEKMFEHDRWVELIDKAEEKGINKAILRKLCIPEVRVKLYEAIKTENYEVSPPRIILIPKDEPGEFREVKANEDVDRIVLTLCNDCLMEIFHDMIFKSSVAYQKGLGCQETVQKSNYHIKKALKNGKSYKGDLSKYFDRVFIEWIDKVFDEFERRLGFEKGTEPVINMLRKYYHSDWLFDVEGNLIQQYTSLKQGCAVAAVLANVILYDVDIEMDKLCDYYVRYSDDLLLIGKNAELAKQKLEEMLPMYGLQLNPKKVEEITSDKWFTFLGMQQKGDYITLSKNRTKKITKEIWRVTSGNPNVTKSQAIANVKRALYGNGDSYSWATACFSAMNCPKDVDTLNGFIMDNIRLCEMREKKYKQRKDKGLKVKPIKYRLGKDVGGIGVENRYDDHTMTRGTGSKMSDTRNYSKKEIEKYKSMGCLLGAYQLSKPIYESVLAGWQ